MIEKRRFQNREKRIALLSFMMAMVFVLASCGNEKKLKNISNISLNDEANKYIEEKYGIADNPIYGKRITHTVHNYGSSQTTYDTRFNEGTHAGAVFYKTVKTQEHPNGLICVYLSDDENGGISLNVTHEYDYKSDGGSHTATVCMPEIKNRCYVIVQSDYLLTAVFSEKEDITSSSEMVYEEKITAYNLNNNLEQVFEITRKIDPNENGERKEYHINDGDYDRMYAYGYNNTTFKGDKLKFISTEQEFCDKANELLRGVSVNCVRLNKSSWNNRWYGTDVDESDINKNMVKVDFAASSPVTDTNGDEVVDITITVNEEKQELSDGEHLEEIEDNSVTYKQPAEEKQDEVVMPANIPASVDETSLQDLRYFDIDGFWYSDDLKYVYHIYTKQPDNGFGTLYFTDLKGNGEAKHGQVKQTSTYSVILKAMEDKGFSPEVFAVNNQLKSDEITLIKAQSKTVNNILGSWSNNNVTYEFKDDGIYDVDKSTGSYWGFYFVIDDSKIVLGERSGGLELLNYSISGNTLIINDNLTLMR